MSEIKQDIIKRTVPILLERGLKTSMDELSQSLCISKRTIYENFENKDELISHCIDFIISEGDEAITKFIRQCNNPIEEMFPILHENVRYIYGLKYKLFADLKRVYPKLYEDFQSKHQVKYNQRMQGIIQRGKQQGLFREEINADIVLYFLPKISSVLSDQKITLSGIYSMRDVFENIMVPFMRGMLTKKGIEVYDVVIERFKKYTPDL